MASQKITEKSLPQSFMVKLLGRKPSKGLWGIKQIREPVDEMILEAKELNLSLPIVKLHLSEHGIRITHFPTQLNDQLKNNHNTNNEKKRKPAVRKTLKSLLLISQKKHHDPYVDETELKTDFILLENMKQNYKYRHDESFFGIDSISYGVQDLIYTRVFSIIVLSDDPSSSRFHCYAFICEDRQVARDLTYALSAAFQVYSRTIKAGKPTAKHTPVKSKVPKILSVDLMSCRDSKFDNFGVSEA